jgi:CheY-like chemotaxis protein
VRLPLTAAAPTAPTSAGPDSLARDGHLIAGTRVLVVDDEADARDLTRVILESRGARVVAVAGVSDALQTLREERFDALIADIGMPGADGFTLIRAIRSLPPDGGGTMLAVAVTAYATLRERQEALAAGFDEHVGKPIDADRLVAALAAAGPGFDRPLGR